MIRGRKGEIINGGGGTASHPNEDYTVVVISGAQGSPDACNNSSLLTQRLIHDPTLIALIVGTECVTVVIVVVFVLIIVIVPYDINVVTADIVVIAVAVVDVVLVVVVAVVSGSGECCCLGPTPSTTAGQTATVIVLAKLFYLYYLTVKAHLGTQQVMVHAQCQLNTLL